MKKFSLWIQLINFLERAILLKQSMHIDQATDDARRAGVLVDQSHSDIARGRTASYERVT